MSPGEVAVPRLSDERRAANRAAIVDAARRCFARDGFHQTSMPDIVAEAGISAGAFYRYFASKEDVVGEIARQAFGAMGTALGALLAEDAAPSVGDVVATLVDTLAGPTARFGGREVDLDEQFRVAVQAWGEALRDPDLRHEARSGIAAFTARLAAALDRGRAAGTVPAALDPADGAQLVVAVLPGLILQRAVLGLDVHAVGRAARALLGP